MANEELAVIDSTMVNMENGTLGLKLYFRSETPEDILSCVTLTTARIFQELEITEEADVNSYLEKLTANIRSALEHMYDRTEDNETPAG